MSFLFRWYPYIAGMSILIALTVWIYMNGYQDCQDNHLKAAIKEENAYVKIEQKNMRLSDTQLHRALCAHWMRRPCPKT
jgi:hypothetical protein